MAAARGAPQTGQAPSATAVRPPSGRAHGADHGARLRPRRPPAQQPAVFLLLVKVYVAGPVPVPPAEVVTDTGTVAAASAGVMTLTLVEERAVTPVAATLPKRTAVRQQHSFTSFSP